MRYPALLIAAAILFVSFGARAEEPGFTVAFNFKPAFNAGAPTPPDFYLDVCGDTACNSVSTSIMMTCNMVSANNVVVVSECRAHAVMRPRNPDPNMGFLGSPTTLRLRASNILSAPFYFGGGQPSVPHSVYKFAVALGPTGFGVMQQQ
jgi:hypothetical protein